MSYEAPFAGLRVADLSQGIAGPYCAMLLAQHGADVIKVEPPAGDWSRTLGVRHGDQSAFSIAANLGKRSIVVDLKEERALRAAGIMHERVNTHPDYVRHPHVEASGTVIWLDQPGVGRVPVPWPPGLTPPASGSRRATAPGLDEHGKEILAELGLAR
jgi:crotonobetainyl-CoA:carnitine CoA-transferase CaiB-like acyl-CoA transferase